jgi:enamine deaminase RidA (YjgF/YER057c/UK114 family)
METTLKLTFLSPLELGTPFAPYSQIARARASELLFIAGQVATRPDGTIAGEDDFETQCEQVFENIGMALRHADGDWSNVAQFTSYLVREDDIAAFKRYRERKFKQLFPDGNYPINTLLIIKRLVVDTLRLEVQTIAVK